MEVYGYIDLRTTFGEGESTKIVTLRYQVVGATSSYNIIIDRPTLNALIALISYPHPCIKYPLPNGKVGVVRGYQAMAHKCYVESAKVKTILKKEEKGSNCSYLDLDLWTYDAAKEKKRPKPAEDLNEIIIGPTQHQKKKIETRLSLDIEDQLIKLFSDNVHVIAWSPQDMPEIDPNFICYRLSLALLFSL